MTDKEKCNLPWCERDAILHFSTIDGKIHAYCSIDHANDHRNILIAEMIKK